MFTVLVEEKGAVRQLKSVGNACDITIHALLVLQDASLGDSIAINGCCLTVVKFENEVLTFQAGSETLSQTKLGELVEGSPVNLERALQVGQRMGGHPVMSIVWGQLTSEATMESGPSFGSKCRPSIQNRWRPKDQSQSTGSA